MSRRRSIWLLPAAVLAATALTAAPALAQDDPEELIIGFVPSVEAGALVEDIKPLSDYLSEALGIPVEGFVSSDYAALVTAMQTGQAHIAALPPFGLVQAVDVAGAEMILQSERYGSPSYHTQFITTDAAKYCADEPVMNERKEGDEMLPFLNCNGTDRAYNESPIGPIGLEALEAVEAGTKVSFTEPTSSSGYIFPATIFAAQMGLNPETDLDAVFAGGHDASVIAVCKGQAEVGVSFDDARSDAVTDCDVPGTVITFAYGPEIPNDGLAVAGDLSDDLKASIKQALLDFAATEDGAAVLDEIYNINAFAEPVQESLQIIRDAVEELGYGS
ncbi:MAG: phosphate/phosphite/phosphonate ABC transporter substrate-binding protein [Chloroflexota bacterium]|nr:phosphate/phosphite/phosphonate ABC transporter substrate-binding protein [Chloroflexota bacterium]